jgi:predicted CXXCH cytochrome family protein
MNLATRFFLLLSQWVIALFLLFGMANSKAEAIAASVTSDFVDNARCLECHSKQANEWLGSHHEKSMQIANKDSVLGDFNNISFSDSGVTSRFFQKEGKYFINTEGEDGNYSDFEVKYTFGVAPLQQYLLIFPKGRLQAFTVAWDVNKKRWFDLYPNEKVNPQDSLHWTKRAFTANSSCMECHMTNMSLNFDVKAKEYKTHWSEINVSCQSCHGPGKQHLKWVGNQSDETLSAAEKSSKGLVVDYKKSTAKSIVEGCASCHSRRYSVNDQHNIRGQSYLDHFMPELLRPDSYHADGQVKDEVYVYGSFVQSKMYHKGVSCNDCHNPHSAKLQKTGNALCLQCHQEKPPTERFNTLKSKIYATEKHHFHKSDSAGAQCVNCHMPTSTYMQVDPRHDHSFSIPRPDLSKQWKTPNACNSCHKEKTLDWAIEAMDKWYGKSWQQRPNTANTFGPARAGQIAAKTSLLTLIKDGSKPDIVRATALELSQQYNDPIIFKTKLQMLSSDIPLLRITALQNLDNLSEAEKIALVTPLLDDEIRGVRIEAGKLLANVSQKVFTATQKQQLNTALQAYKAAQSIQTDYPEGYLNLGNLYENMNTPFAAETAYQQAIDLDPQFVPAANNLANFYYNSGNKDKAESVFKTALEHSPNAAYLHYSLSLLLAEKKDDEQAVFHLGKAAALLPNNAKIHYNQGLLLQKLEKTSEAEKALLHAYQINSSDPKILKALIVFYQKYEKDKAKIFIERLNFFLKQKKSNYTR